MAHFGDKKNVSLRYSEFMDGFRTLDESIVVKIFEASRACYPPIYSSVSTNALLQVNSKFYFLISNQKKSNPSLQLNSFPVNIEKKSTIPTISDPILMVHLISFISSFHL